MLLPSGRPKAPMNSQLAAFLEARIACMVPIVATKANRPQVQWSLMRCRPLKNVIKAIPSSSTGEPEAAYLRAPAQSSFPMPAMLPGSTGLCKPSSFYLERT
jgi:hypothetical protein